MGNNVDLNNKYQRWPVRNKGSSGSSLVLSSRSSWNSTVIPFCNVFGRKSTAINTLTILSRIAPCLSDRIILLIRELIAWLFCLFSEVIITVEGEYLRYITKMDASSLETLMKEYGQDVWNYAFVLTKNRSIADDIVQEVFMQAFRHIVSFRGESSVKTWLMRITRNRSLNYRNSAFFRRVVLVDRVFGNQTERSAEDVVVEQELSNDVWRAVLRLPRVFREVIILEVKYGLPTSEIANLLHISEGTVKSRLFRARKKLHGFLKGEMTNE
jgi:RNA polymerase sigma-70 factor (ECF subfamily)